jgi:hypothetical protein
MDIDFSPDGGITWQSIVSGTSDDGYHNWQVPDVNTSSGLIRVVAYDNDGNTGEDQGNGFFSINGTAVTGDVNGDGIVNVTDLLMVIDSWGVCELSCPADLNGDGVVDVVDLLAVLGAW